MPQNAKISISYGFTNVKLGPDEVIIGFDIDVSGGGFESISSLPKGWRIAVDNRSASNTRVNADLAYGDVGITTEFLAGIVLTVSKIEQEGQPFKLIGSMLANRLGTERRILLSIANFVPK